MAYSLKESYLMAQIGNEYKATKADFIEYNDTVVEILMDYANYGIGELTENQLVKVIEHWGFLKLDKEVKITIRRALHAIRKQNAEK